MAPQGVNQPGDAPAMSHKEMANATCSYPFMARPWKQGYETRLAAFDGCFIDARANDPVSDVRSGHSTVRIMNLPLVNTWLARITDPAQQVAIANALHFVGTLRNDEQLSGGAPGHLGPRSGKAYTRILNVDVRGSSRVRNYWPSATQGDRLTFCIVRTRVNSLVAKTQLPEQSGASRCGARVRELRAQLMLMRAQGYAEADLQRQFTMVRDAERAERAHNNDVTVLQVRPAVGREADRPVASGLLRPGETIVRVLDVGFAFEHIPRAFSSSKGLALAARTTFDGNDSLPVIR